MISLISNLDVQHGGIRLRVVPAAGGHMEALVVETDDGPAIRFSFTRAGRYCGARRCDAGDLAAAVDNTRPDGI